MRVCYRCGEQESRDRPFSRTRTSYCNVCRALKARERYAAKRDACLAVSTKYRTRNAKRIRERRRKRYAENRQKLLAERKAYREANREKVLEARRKWGEKNKAYVKAKKRESYHRNATTNKERSRDWYYRNKDRVLKYQEAWRKKNPEKRHEYQARRRARKRGATTEVVYRKVVWENDDRCCYLCSRPVALKKMHLEHVIPLAAGGGHNYANCRCSCAPCNLKKGRKHAR